MSTNYVLLGVCSLILLGACVDPQQRFDDFGDRVVDAAPSNLPPGTLFDISDQHYLVIRPAPSPTSRIHYIVDVEMDIGQAVINSIRFSPLHIDDRVPVPDSGDEWTAITAQRPTGSFELPVMELVIPNPANPINGDVIVTTGAIVGRTFSEDLWCGTVDGETNLGTPLDGSTFSAQRVMPGTVGIDLPEPMFECPDAMMSSFR